MRFPESLSAHQSNQSSTVLLVVFISSWSSAAAFVPPNRVLGSDFEAKYGLFLVCTSRAAVAFLSKQ
jgi:hypothetical protein